MTFAPHNRTSKILLKKPLAPSRKFIEGGIFDASLDRPFKNPSFSFIGTKRKWKNAKSLQTGTREPGEHSFFSIEALPSLLPQRKYCDITGLESSYIEPKSGMYYSSSDLYPLIKSLSTAQVQDYLHIRKAHTVLK